MYVLWAKDSLCHFWYLCFFLYGMSSTYKLYKEWWRVNSKYNSKELQHFGFSFCFTNLWSILWYSRPIGRIPILRYISAMSHTRTIGYLRNLRSTLIKSCWSFGPGWMTSFMDFPSYFAVLSHSILTFLVNLSGQIYTKCRRNHPLYVFFLVSTYSRYHLLIQLSMLLQYFKFGCPNNLFPVFSNLLNAVI